MYLILFLLYTVVACYILLKSSFIKKSALIPYWIIALFLIKIIASCFYGWFHLKYYPLNNDTWQYFDLSLNEYHLLLHHPAAYFHELIYSHQPAGYNKIFSTKNSFWNNFGVFLVVRLQVLFNLLSGGRYYVNCIFYSLVIFYGQIALYRAYKNNFPACPAIILLVTIFLFPSILFWTSGIHKDGILLCLLGILIFSFQQILKRKSALNIIAGALSACLIFLMRNYIFLALLPPLAAWFCSKKFPKIHPLIFFCGVYVIFFAAYFLSGNISPSLNIPQKVIQRRMEFDSLSGNSRLPFFSLQPTVKSFVKQAPVAVDHVLLEPHLPYIKQPLYLLTFLENICWIILLLVCIYFRKKNFFREPILLFSLFFAITIFLLIGYTVPFLGAIVRYRSVPMVFFLSGILLMVKWKEIIAAKWLQRK